VRLFNPRILRLPSYWVIAALPLAGLPLATAAAAGPLDDVKEMTRELTGQGEPYRDRDRGPNRDRDGRDRDDRDRSDRDRGAQRDNDRDRDRNRNAEGDTKRGNDRERDARRGDDRDKDRNGNRDARRDNAPIKRDTRRADKRGNMDDIKKGRRERSEDGGKRTVIEEPGNRVIVKERGGRATISHDETERFRRGRGDVQTKKRDGGGKLTIAVRPGGIKVYSEYDDKGRLERRYRRGRDGRETTLIDSRKARRHRRDGRAGFYVDLRPPQVRIPRRKYVVEYEDASESDVYDALMAPPVDDLERSYTLEEVRYNRNLRDRMRRIDLDTINFEFGSWQVERDQYRKLERVARAINRILDRRPDELFFVEGHTDAVGSDIDNLTLSDRRAEEVAIILSDTFDVPPENLITQGYGEEFLKIETERAERANRRVAVRRITPLIASR
jgi:outer membrane protein OmpA-like peptidoglycan-associated protein